MTFKLPRNSLRMRLENDEMAFGIYVSVPSPVIVELAALAGLDFVRLDLAHGPYELPALENMIRAAEIHGITPMARLHPNGPTISNLLEMGMMGIVVPDIASREEAQEVIAAAKFAPIGRRGMFSATRRAGYGKVSAGAFREWTNQEILVGVQIENLEAVERLDDILDVPGIDLVLSGRGDLANALDLPGQRTHPTVLELEERIFHAARQRGLAISPQLDPDAPDFEAGLQAVTDAGARIVSLGADLTHISRAFARINGSARSLSGAVS